MKTLHIICEHKGCANYNTEINSIDVSDDEVHAFYKDFGHSEESNDNICDACGVLGVLQ